MQTSGRKKEKKEGRKISFFSNFSSVDIDFTLTQLTLLCLFSQKPMYRSFIRLNIFPENLVYLCHVF